MKKILLSLGVLVLILSGCSKNEILETTSLNSYSNLATNDLPQLISLAKNLSKTSNAYSSKKNDKQISQEDLSKNDAKILIEAALNVNFGASAPDYSQKENDGISKEFQLNKTINGLVSGYDIATKYSWLQAETIDLLGNNKSLHFIDISILSETNNVVTYLATIKTKEGVSKKLKQSRYRICYLNEMDYWWAEEFSSQCGPYSGENLYIGAPERVEFLMNRGCTQNVCPNGETPIIVLSTQVPFGPTSSPLGNLEWQGSNLCLSPSDMADAINILEDIKELHHPNPLGNFYFSSINIQSEHYFVGNDILSIYWHGTMRYITTYCQGGFND